MRRASRSTWRAIRHASLWLALTAGAGLAHTQTAGGDAAAKAKLVATLARFVQWPPTAFEYDTSPLRLCVFANSPTVERAFQGLSSAAVGTRPLQTLVNPGAVARSCHVVYIDDAAFMTTDRLLRGLAAEPAFSVGSQDGFVSEGGMVEIVQVDNALRFDVNLNAMHAARLGINPGVLKLARQVRQ
jgi:hypothetical protein